MSDSWIAIVPEDPDFIPPPQTQQAALGLLQTIAPDAEEIEIKLSDTIQFFDCGENLERITCPRCGQEISIDWWQDRMDEDQNGNGFQMKRYPIPCCGAAVNLNELRYEWPQAFARFGIDAKNPNIGELPCGEREELERILGTPLRVVYQHI